MDTTGTFFLPPSGSTFAPQVDALLSFLLYMSLFFLIVIFSAVILFLVKYRRRGEAADTTTAPEHNTALEILWTAIPLVLVIFLFVWGFKIYMRMSIAPKDALEIKVTGQKWFWSFLYPDGTSSVNDLVVPVGKPVKLLLSSNDVIHSFFVPAFRVKRDALPNRYTIVWFETTQEGNYDLFCAEYCGTKHSKMIGKVRVVSDRVYTDWLAASGKAGEGLSPVEFGAKLYAKKGCMNCHSVDGTPGNGPSFLNLFRHQTEFNQGTPIVADENYVRESILNPAARVVAGYQPIMPTYQTLLKPADVDALVAYIKSLSK